MRTKIQKWGNSQGLRIPKNILDDAHLDIGDEVDVMARDGIIVVAPTQSVRGRYRLEDLVARIPEDYKPGEVDWGGPAGKEVW